MVNKKYTLDSFSEIKIIGNFDILLIQGSDNKLSLEGKEKDIDNTLVYIEDSILHIKQKKRVVTRIKCVLHFSKISALHFSGYGTIEGGSLQFRDYYLSTNGSINIDLNLEVNTIHVESSGNTKILLKGSSEKQEIRFNGFGEYDGKYFKSSEGKLELFGMGKVVINTTKSLNIRVYGSGTVRYVGDPCVNQNIFGSCRIEKVIN
jgi:hypothetical protein